MDTKWLSQTSATLSTSAYCNNPTAEPTSTTKQSLLEKIPYYTNELDGLSSKQIGQLIHVQFSGMSRYMPLLQLEYSTDLSGVRL
jgi:hypothetical protein